MFPETSAHIFLKEWGLISENETARAVRVLLGQAPIACALLEMEEQTLAPGVSTLSDADYGLLLLPVVGNLELYRQGFITDLTCGQLGYIPPGMITRIRNPYTQELIRFIRLQVRQKDYGGHSSYSRHSFDLREQKGSCIPVMECGAIRVCIGLFPMRVSAAYSLHNTDACIFGYVLQGSMEIDGRLLHAGDALYLWNTRSAELESFGKESILLIIESPYTPVRPSIKKNTIYEPDTNRNY